MNRLFSKPLDEILADYWHRLDDAYRRAFFVIVGINILAFGFEMTNLTIHHDDLIHMFAPPELLGYYLGRFSVGWLHQFTQNAYIMPFLQLFEGICVMTLYGLLVSHYWGLRRTMEIVLVSAIVSIFPYIGQIYQYNTNMAIYPIAHLLSALAVIFSTRATIKHIILSAFLFMLSFSIYQSVLANASVIFGFWVLANLLFQQEGKTFFSLRMAKSAASVLVSVTAGGLIYMLIISFMDIPFDSVHGANQAFTFTDGIDLSSAVLQIIEGTRSFFFWPENYFPNYLKKIQLLLGVGAAIFCLWLPNNWRERIIAVLLFGICLFAPRVLQLLHPEGNYHQLSLTAYSVVIAGFVMIILRTEQVVVKNLSVVLTMVLIFGYALQCNWISTVNYLNTNAHYSTMTQILSRIKSLDVENWRETKVVVVGSYKMPSDYPFKRATGVSTTFIDAKHMQKLARLLREDIEFMPAEEINQQALDYAAKHAPWPSPSSVGMVDSMGVLVLSHQ